MTTVLCCVPRDAEETVKSVGIGETILAVLVRLIVGEMVSSQERTGADVERAPPKRVLFLAKSIVVHAHAQNFLTADSEAPSCTMFFFLVFHSQG